jgi:hypothetical protein
MRWGLVSAANQEHQRRRALAVHVELAGCVVTQGFTIRAGTLQSAPANSGGTYCNAGRPLQVDRASVHPKAAVESMGFERSRNRTRVKRR